MSARRFVLLLAIALAPGSVAIAGEADAPRSASWVVVPGASIGPVRLGMGPAEVTAALGKPEVITDGSHWHYERDGLTVVFDLDKPVVDALIAGGGRSPREAAAKCRAHTEAGVGTGSSREQVVSALGPADKQERDSLGSEHLHYRSLGLNVTIFEGRAIRLEVVPRGGPTP